MDDVKGKMQELSDAVIARAGQLRFHKSDPQQLYSVALLGTIVEGFAAAATLVQQGNCSPVPAIGRTVLEAYVDLLNLIQNHTYVNRMEATYLKEQIKVIREAINSKGKNPWLIGLAQVPDIESNLKERLTQLAAYEEQGCGPLSVFDRFQLCGYEAMYRSVYAELCIHSHNNIRALDDRHIDESDGEAQVVFFRGTRLGEIEHFLENLSGCTVDALHQVGKVARYEEGTSFDNVDRIRDELISLFD